MHERLDRADVDDAPLAGAQRRGESLRHVEDAVEVGRDHRLPVGGHGVSVGRERIAAGDAGIVHENGYPAELPGNLRRHRPAGGAVADVEGKGLRLAAGVADRLRRLGRRPAIYVERGHGRALARVAESDGAANAGARTGNDRNVVLEESGHEMSFRPVIIDAWSTITMN